MVGNAELANSVDSLALRCAINHSSQYAVFRVAAQDAGRGGATRARLLGARAIIGAGAVGAAPGLGPCISRYFIPPGRLSGHQRCFHVSCRLAVREVRLALSDLDNIAVGISDIAARLAVLVLRLRDELGSSISP